MVKVILIFFFLCLPLLRANYEPLDAPWGRDSELAMPKQEVAKQPRSKISTKLIRFYQNYISPIDGPRSSFRPSSSEYMLQAINAHGFCKGFVMGCDRLMRENKAEWVYEVIETEEGERKVDPVR